MSWDWLNPIHGVGYQFWSGAGASIVPLAIGVVLWLAPTRCHELGCRRRARGAAGLNGFYYCERHMPKAQPAGMRMFAGPVLQRCKSKRPHRAHYWSDADVWCEGRS